RVSTDVRDRRAEAHAGRLTCAWPNELLRAADELDAWLGRFHQAAIGGEIIERHAARGKPALEYLADFRAIEVGQPADLGDGADLVLDDKAGLAIIHDLGNRAAVEGDHGGPAGHRLDHDKS